MGFPEVRMRRLRRNAAIRNMVAETRLMADDFILPLFACPGERVRAPIAAMPGVYRSSIDGLLETCGEAVDAGVGAVLLFGIPDAKDDEGRSGYAEDGIVQRAIAAIKRRFNDLYVITDVCNCEYTTHGHCGPLVNGEVANDATLDILALQALSHARAGCDMVAPSDMMDGRVKRIRAQLDSAGFELLPILSYAVKYASAFYGPFREAAGSAPAFGDRRGYQMDPRNGNEALREVHLDIDEGADMVMVKPALSYLDVVRRIRETSTVPVAAYNVSGEYSMVKAAADRGWIDGKAVMMEILTSIKRAGAQAIITYHAVEAAKLLAVGR